MLASPPTTDAILRSARASIIAGGYNGFSYADIAAAVGIRKPSIHHHFPTKADLVRKLVQQYREEAEAGLVAVERAASDPLEQLSAFAGYWESCLGEPETSFCLCALLATQIPVLPEGIVLELRAYFRALSAWLTSALERGVQQGIISLSSSAAVEAEAFMATVHGAMSSARAYGDPHAFSAIVRPAIDRLRAVPIER